MAAVRLHQALARLALGILDQHPALRPLHITNEQDEAERHDDDQHDQQARNGAFATRFEQVAERHRQLGDDTGHDDERHAIANAARGDLLAQPHQEHGAADQRYDRGEAEQQAGIDHRLDARLRAEAFKASGDEIALHRGQADRAIAGILVELLAPAFTFLLDRRELRREGGGQLHHDRRGDIGHDAERDEAHARQRTTREGVEDVEDAAIGLRIQRR